MKIGVVWVKNADQPVRYPRPHQCSKRVHTTIEAVLAHKDGRGDGTYWARFVYRVPNARRTHLYGAYPATEGGGGGGGGGMQWFV